MPIYEYNCPKCNNHFEVLIRSKKDIPALCPKCKKGKPQKAFSAFAVSTSQPPSSSACPTCPSAGTGCGRACSMNP